MSFRQLLPAAPGRLYNSTAVDEHSPQTFSILGTIGTVGTWQLSSSAGLCLGELRTASPARLGPVRCSLAGKPVADRASNPGPQSNACALVAVQCPKAGGIFSSMGQTV